MSTRNEFWRWTILGEADLETRYATILVVLATTATICYAAFTTSRRYRLIPPWMSPVNSRRSPHEPLTAKNSPVDLSTSACSEAHPVADNTDGPSPSPDVADPIVEPEVLLAESELPVLEDLPRSQPSSISLQSEAHLDSEVDVSDFEGPQAEEPRQELPEVDSAIPQVPLRVDSEVESGASSPDTDTEPLVVEVQGTTDASLPLVSADFDESQRNVELVESWVTSPDGSLQTHSPEDIEAPMTIETPFLLSVNSSVDDDATLCEEGSSEDDAGVAEPPSECGLAESVLDPSPYSVLGSPHDDAPSFIMQSALLVPAESATDEDPSSSETAVELEADDDWTSVNPEESSTLRPSSPVDSESRIEGSTGEVRSAENDLAVSAVLLTQSQYASVILPPISANDSGPTSLASSTSFTSARPRIHTSDRPDWAVAPQGGQEDTERRERVLRRHSLDSPDWAVAPESTDNGMSSTKKQGRRSDPGSGKRRKSRRAWTSR